MKKERRNRRNKNKKPNKLIQMNSPHNFKHRVGVKPSIPKTSEELCEINEIKSEDDLYKNLYFLDWTYEGQVVWNKDKDEFVPHGYGKEIFTQVTSVFECISPSQEKEVSYEGGFNTGNRDGYGIVTLNTGTTWEGSFKDGLRHGKGYGNFRFSHNFIQSGHDLIECRDEFENGRQVGDMEMVYEDGGTTICPLSHQKQFNDSYSDSTQQVKEEFKVYGESRVMEGTK